MRDGESIKLFVGQVPRDFTEKDLKDLFEVYGEIKMLKLITDKISGQHKGCAFLTFFSNESAKAAQDELHEKRTLPGARSVIQVKPAASEIKDENRKLYVGMLSRKLDVNDIQAMFDPYGPIEDVTVLKNQDGKSRGCAFIKYETRQHAQNAIRALHNSETMEGCRYPIVVKIADTDKDKQNKRNMQPQNFQQQPQQQHNIQQSFLPQQQQLQQAVSNLSSVGLQSFGTANVIGAAGNNSIQQQLLAQMGLPQLVAANPGFAAVGAPGAAAPGSVGAFVAAMALQQQQHAQPQVQVLNQQQALTDAQGAQGNTSIYGSQLASSYTLPQVSNTYGTTLSGLGTNASLGTGLQGSLGSAIQGQLGATLPSQLGGQFGGQLQGQLGGQLQNQLGLTGQLGSALTSQLGMPVQNQLAQPGSQLAQQTQLGVGQQAQLQQSQYGGVLQGQLGQAMQGQQLTGTSLQSQLGTSLPGQLSSTLSGQLTGSLQNQLGASGAPGSLAAYGGQLGYSTVGAGSTGLVDNTLQQAYSGIQQYAATVYPQQTSYPSNVRGSATNGGLQQNQQQSNNQNKKEGPDGANLFIYQIPTEFTDNDLMQTFAPYGNVISAKVFLDRNTGLSKGFGFVSYDNPSSANAAISAMNGAAIGSKRLRVQHKRPKESGRPY